MPHTMQHALRKKPYPPRKRPNRIVTAADAARAKTAVLNSFFVMVLYPVMSSGRRSK